MRPIGRSIQQWRQAHAPDGQLVLVMTYPHYLYLRDLVRPDRQVYFNIDDYSQYWPRSARRVNELERQAVREADLTVCVSRLRAEELRGGGPRGDASGSATCPTASPRRRWPSTPGSSPPRLPPTSPRLPRPILGYVGSLEDRVDWTLLTRLSEAFPGASIVIVGRPVGRRQGAWYDDYRRCLARPNVHALGWRPQDVIHALQPRVRRLPDPLPHRPPVQPRLQPDQDHGLHGHGPADRLDGGAGVPALRPALPRRRRPSTTSSPRSARSSTPTPTTAAPPSGSTGPAPTPAGASSTAS